MLWGLFPLYFCLFASVPAVEVVLQRSLRSLVFIGGLLAWQRRGAWLAPFVAQPRRLAPFALSALLLVVNTLANVYAIQTRQVVEASLGYFINPLVLPLLAWWTFTQQGVFVQGDTTLIATLALVSADALRQSLRGR